MSHPANTESFGLNTILYGPPGTGKTYHVIKDALIICDGESSDDEKEYIKRYRELKEQGRIEFITFHQSYSYEDFIEGIKPVLPDDSNTEDKMSTEGNGEGADQSAGTLSYTVKPGIFKLFCERAREAKKKAAASQSSSNPSPLPQPTVQPEPSEDHTITLEKNHAVWLINQDNNKYIDSWFDDNCIVIPTGVAERDKCFRETIKPGDYIMIRSTPFETINKSIIGIAIAGEAVDVPDAIQERKVEWIYQRENEDETLDLSGIDPLNNASDLWDNTYLFNIHPFLIKQEDIVIPIPYADADAPAASAPAGALDADDGARSDTDNYVFIIDEINRGNISKIFGELITLIEDDKREGKVYEMSTTLPNSHETFSVPENVYILGTMNTADRSIALLDTALRRRFCFKEMMPDPSKLDGIIVEAEGVKIEIKSLLEAMNARIEVLLDREHTIGHAYLMPTANDVLTFEKLQRIFKDRIIPLVQEYFYDDYEKIDLVLNGNGFMTKKQYNDKDDEKSEFLKNILSQLPDLPEIVYEINEEELIRTLKDPKRYQRIYDNSIKIDE